MNNPYRDLELVVETDYYRNDVDDIQGYNILNAKTSEEVIGSEGLLPEDEKIAHLFAASPKLLNALIYAKRFLKKEDVDMEFIDDAIKQALNE